MKKLVALLLAVMMCVLTGCRDRETQVTEGTAIPAATTALAGKTLEECVDLIYGERPLELSVMTIPVDLDDAFAVKSYLGLSDSGKISEAVASESAFGSQAYSLVLCRVKDAGQAQDVAREMFEGIDRRKWVCVEADDLVVTVHGDLVLLVMIGSEYEQMATAEQLAHAFSKVSGTEPELVLEDR